MLRASLISLVAMFALNAQAEMSVQEKVDLLVENATYAGHFDIQYVQIDLPKIEYSYFERRFKKLSDFEGWGKEARVMQINFRKDQDGILEYTFKRAPLTATGNETDVMRCNTHQKGYSLPRKVYFQKDIEFVLSSDMPEQSKKGIVGMLTDKKVRDSIFFGEENAELSDRFDTNISISVADDNLGVIAGRQCVMKNGVPQVGDPILVPVYLLEPEGKELNMRAQVKPFYFGGQLLHGFTEYSMKAY